LAKRTSAAASSPADDTDISEAKSLPPRQFRMRIGGKPRNRRAWQPSSQRFAVQDRIEAGRSSADRNRRQSHGASFANQKPPHPIGSTIRVLVTRWHSILPSSSLERAVNGRVGSDGISTARDRASPVKRGRWGSGAVSACPVQLLRASVTAPSSPRMIQTIGGVDRRNLDRFSCSRLVRGGASELDGRFAP